MGDSSIQEVSFYHPLYLNTALLYLNFSIKNLKTLESEGLGSIQEMTSLSLGHTTQNKSLKFAGSRFPHLQNRQEGLKIIDWTIVSPLCHGENETSENEEHLCSESTWKCVEHGRLFTNISCVVVILFLFLYGKLPLRFFFGMLHPGLPISGHGWSGNQAVVVSCVGLGIKKKPHTHSNTRIF